MIGIKVNADISRASRLFDNLREDQLPFATALALTKTAQKVQADVRKEMQHVFLSAVPYTLNSLYVLAATKSSQVSVVGVKNKRGGAIEWLLPEIEGGPRPSGIEVFLKPANLPPPGMYAVPGLYAPISSNGKTDVNALRRIVSQLSAVPTGVAGLRALRSRGQSRKAAYFALLQPDFGLKPGIYGVRGREIQPIIIFVKRPMYRRRLDFYGVAQRSAERYFADEFDAAAQRAIATAR